MTWAVFCALALILACCAFLTLHHHYEDGVVGRVALACMALASMMLMAEYMSGAYRDIPGPMVLLCIGAATFIARHTYRFLLWRFRGEGDWRGDKRGSRAVR